MRILARSPLLPTRGQNQKGPTLGRTSYITPAVWRVTNKGKKLKMAQTWADWLHHPCRLGGHQQIGNNRKGPHVGMLATSPLPYGGSPTRGQKS